MDKPTSKIRHLRRKKNLTQGDLAAYCGVSVITIRSWEKNYSAVYKWVDLILLCRLLSCTPKELVGELICSNSIQDLNQIRQRVRQPHHPDLEDLLPQNKIAELRGVRGLTQKDLANALQIAESTVQSWESGRTSLKYIYHLVSLCNILECDYRELMDGIPQAKIDAVESYFKSTLNRSY